MATEDRFDFNLFRALEVFAAVAETGQVTRAAALLGVTQSAASQHLGILEKALGARLFDRATRPLEPTPAGLLLRRRAGRILNEIDDLKSELRRVDLAPRGVLRIAMLASIATTLTGEMTRLAERYFGNPELTLLAGLASDHQTLLGARRADMAITSDAFYDLDGLDRHQVLKESFLLVLPKGFDGPSDDLSALAERLTLARLTPTAPVGRRTDQHLRRLRLDIPRRFEADRASMVLAAVATGRAFALLSPTLMLDGFAEGMALDIRRPPMANFSREITLLARAGEFGATASDFAAGAGQALRAAIAAHLPPLASEAVAD